jgi:hypothetical protein
MRFEGRVIEVGRYWAVEVPILDLVTQGRSRRDALGMVADAVETLVNRPGFTAEVFPVDDHRFEIGSSDTAALAALLLRRARQRSGLTLAQVALRLGSGSPNSYARYEQGRAVPTVRKLVDLLAAVSADRAIVIAESRAGV